MLIARHLLSCISKAVKNNQKSIILKINQVKNFYILDIICKHGFIQGYEVRGRYIIVSLKQVYRNSITISAEKSLNNIIPIKRKKNSCSISAKE
jgi:ribosomal protein S8